MTEKMISPKNLSSSSAFLLSHRPLLQCTVVENSIVAVGSDHCGYSIDKNKRVIVLDNCKSSLPSHSEWVTCCAIYDNNTIITGGMDGQLLSWKGPHSKKMDKQNFHQSSITKISVFQRSYLATSSYDGKLGIWDLKTASLIFDLVSPISPNEELDYMHKTRIPVLDFEVSENRLVATTRKGDLLVYDLNFHNTIHTIQPTTRISAHKGPIVNISILDCGKILTAGTDKFIRVFDTTIPVSLGRCIAKYDSNIQNNTGITNMKSIDQKYFVATGNGKISLFQIIRQNDTKKLTIYKKKDIIINSPSPVGQCCYSLAVGEIQNQKIVISGWGDGKIVLRTPLNTTHALNNTILIVDKLSFISEGLGGCPGMKNAVRSIYLRENTVVVCGDDGVLAIWKF